MKFKKGERVKVTNKAVLAKELQGIDIEITGTIEDGGLLFGHTSYIISLDEFEDKIQVVPEQYLERMSQVA